MYSFLRLFIVGFAFLFCISAWSADVKLQTNFEFHFDKRKGKASNTITTAVGPGWKQIIDTGKGLYVLARAPLLDKDDMIRIEFIIFDTTKKENSVISSPQMIVKLNNKASMETGETDDKKQPKKSFSISITPTLVK